MELKNSENKKQGVASLLPIYFKGMAMGVADIIPGVSGGTIAFILGIYPRLMASLSSINLSVVKLILRLNIRQAIHAFDGEFLMTLIFGVLSAILLSSRLIHYLLGTFPEQTWGFFTGLIGASIIILFNEFSIKKIFNVLLLILGTITGYLIVNLVPVSTPNDLYFYFISGAIAITAMILPGISGSFILLILGKYLTVIGAIKNPFNIENIKIIMVFIIGCLSGILSFSKFLHWLLEKFPQLSMAFLTGFIIGAMKKIWPWRVVDEQIFRDGKQVVLSESLALPQSLNMSVSLTILCMLVGLCLVILLHRRSANK